MVLRLVPPLPVDKERIGDPGDVWATRTSGDRWTVYGWRSGLIVRNVTRAQAEAVIANVDQSRPTSPNHPSRGGAA